MELEPTRNLSKCLWLQSGTIFGGRQYTTDRESSRSAPPIEAYSSGHGSNDLRRLDQDFLDTVDSLQVNGGDQWPIRVKIYEFDSDKMMIQGVLEAYQVQREYSSFSVTASNNRAIDTQENATVKTSTTYFQGWIIDFDQHSFLTAAPAPTVPRPQRRRRQSERMRTAGINEVDVSMLPANLTFPSVSPMADTQNWLHLPPFDNRLSRKHEACDPARLPVEASSTDPASPSPSSIARFAAGYVLMRWKETCFIRESGCKREGASEGRVSGTRGRSHRITIDGFYYVSLCRETGNIEGLYYDPASGSRQRLSLQGGRGGGWGSWEMK